MCCCKCKFQSQASLYTFLPPLPPPPTPSNHLSTTLPLQVIPFPSLPFPVLLPKYLPPPSLLLPHPIRPTSLPFPLPSPLSHRSTVTPTPSCRVSTWRTSQSSLLASPLMAGRSLPVASGGASLSTICTLEKWTRFTGSKVLCNMSRGVVVVCMS